MKNMRQVLSVAVILLFVGVVFAPSINASVVKNELIEFDVEFCGLGKKHTVKLTQQAIMYRSCALFLVSARDSTHDICENLPS